MRLIESMNGVQPGPIDRWIGGGKEGRTSPPTATNLSITTPQDDDTNPLVGAEGRAQLLRSLGAALELHPEFFSSALAGNGEGDGVVYRPGYLVDYLYTRANPGSKEVGG